MSTYSGLNMIWCQGQTRSMADWYAAAKSQFTPTPWSTTQSTPSWPSVSESKQNKMCCVSL